MKKLAAAALTAALAALVCAPTAGAGLPKPKDTARIDVPESIAGVGLGGKIKRANKEKAIKKVMTGCLAERGYTVAGWTKAGKAPKVVEGAGAEAVTK